MLNRTALTAPPNVALTETGVHLVDHLVPDKRAPPQPKSLSGYIIKIGITGTDLNSVGPTLTLEDGSRIQGLSTFMRSDSTQGAAGDTSLVYSDDPTQPVLTRLIQAMFACVAPHDSVGCESTSSSNGSIADTFIAAAPNTTWHRPAA